MTRTRSLVALSLLALLVTGAGSWYLFLPPPATGTPATQPFQVEPDVPASNYRIVANATRTCRNATRTATVVRGQVARVDLEAGVRRSRRVVQTDGRRFTFATFVNDSGTYRRSTVDAKPPKYAHDPDATAVEPGLRHALPVFPRLLRFEWRPVDSGPDRRVLRPRAGYWVAPATTYGVRSRLYVADAAGRLVVTDAGAILDLNLTATTVHATDRFDRHVRPQDRCSVHLAYRYRPARGVVEAPGWLATARNETAARSESPGWG